MEGTEATAVGLAVLLADQVGKAKALLLKRGGGWGVGGRVEVSGEGVGRIGEREGLG